ncbi:hydrogenase maturation nickel metallochaperone HypA [Geminocystis sp. CENA526]|uniref:hydrogenase maturation nickel metallochaperone HypA n=1 Tax=Geminocystis sp. CENA526 TaxID=1355871 RepID=UPI003D6DEC4E
MHEIGIMEETLNLAIDYAMRENAQEITEITMAIGKMSGVIPSALEFAFDVIKQSSIDRYPSIIQKNMSLKIELLPIICYCDSCQENFNPDEWIFQCPQCHQFSNKIIQGKEIKLTSLKIS